MKLGIFGGSFNPPHKMHENIAKSLLDKKYVDKIIFVPTSNYYPKPGLISDKARTEMLKLMIDDNDKMSLSTYEYGRRTYTYETLAYFKSKYPDDNICFICGSDNLREMDTWKNFDEILSLYEIIVIPRGDDIGELLEKYRKYRDNIIIADVDNNYLSSTIIREYLKNRKYNLVKDNINSNVLDYIKKNNLYQ